MELLSKWALLRKCAAAGLARHTTKTRRVVFFAHREAKRTGVPEITPEHLLLGILQVDESLVERLQISSLVRETLAALPAALPTKRGEFSAMSLSSKTRLAVANAAHERDLLGHKHTGTEHLLLGIMRGRSHAAEVLKRYGPSIESVRELIRGQVMAVEWDGGGVCRVLAFG